MDGFADLVTHQYINLITYRKSGETVATPVWFVLENQRVYVYTTRNSGKIKRIRNNAQVLVEPCDARGTPLGAQYQAQARILDHNDYARINRLLNQKYGILKRVFDVMAIFNGGINNRDFIEITART